MNDTCGIKYNINIMFCLVETSSIHIHSLERITCMRASAKAQKRSVALVCVWQAATYFNILEF